MKKIAVTIILLLLSNPAFSQNPSQFPSIWRCKIHSTNAEDVWSIIPFEEIQTIGKQNYIVDGKIEVNEVTIALKPKTYVKFYHLTSVPLLGGLVGDKANEVADKAQDRIQKYIEQPSITPSLQSSNNDKVVKNYPVTTHAQFLEYRVTSLEYLDAIYNTLDIYFLNYKLNKSESPYILCTLIIDQEKNILSWFMDTKKAKLPKKPRPPSKENGE